MQAEKHLIKNQKGDYRYIERLCMDTWEPLYRYIYYRVQNREEAEDITQETYVRAISYIQKKAKVENQIGFLKKVSMNILRDRWRKAKNHGTEINIDVLDPREVSCEDSAESSVQRELVKNALNRLNEAQRKVIELRIIEGYSVSETARMMNKTEGAIRTLQYRALQNLSGILNNNEQ